MKKASIFFMVGMLILFGSSKAFSADPSAAELQKIEQKIQVAETKLSRLQASQAQILEKQTRILEELSNLKIWIRRNRSGGGS